METTLQLVALLSIVWIAGARENSEPCNTYYTIETTEEMMVTKDNVFVIEKLG